MDNIFEIEGTTLVKYRGEGGNVVIPENVTAIGGCVFEECEELTCVTLPKGLKSIGESAFRGCVNLTGISLPEGLEELGEETFSGCLSLTEIEIPGKIKVLPWGVFSGCKSLTYIGLPAGLSKICSRAFDGCEELASVSYGGMKTAWEKVEKNINWAYASGDFIVACKNGELQKDGGAVKKEKPKEIPKPEVPEPDGDEEELYDADEEEVDEEEEEEDAETFGADDGESFTIVAGVLKKYFGGEHCTVPDTVVLVGEAAFRDEKSLQTVKLPESVKVVGASAFLGCTSLTSVKIEGARMLRERAFGGCTKLRSIVLPSTLEKIGSGAFQGCTSLKSVEIPDGVTMIDANAFEGCVSLERIIVNNNPYYKMDGNRLVSNKGTVVATVSAASSAAVPKPSVAPPPRPVTAPPPKVGKPPKTKTKIKTPKKVKSVDTEKRSARLLGWKRFLFILPSLFAIVIGCDIFNGRSGRVGDMIERNILGVCIFFFVVYCVLALLVLIICNVKLSGYGRSVAGFKLKKFSIFIALCLAAMVLANIFAHVGDYSVVYAGGDYVYHEYVKKGEGLYLRSDYTKKMIEQENYVTMYTLSGWEIDGVSYRSGAFFVPERKVRAEATFREQNYGTVTIQTTNASVTVYCDEKIEVDGTTYYPFGATLEIRASYTYSYDYGMKINGKSYNKTSSVSWTMDGNITVKAESQPDNSCLVAGTLITLADGSKKAVEALEIGDMLLSFNHETGQYESAPVFANVHALQPADWYDVVSLNFSDGSTLKIVGEHGLFDLTVGGYVYPTKENYADFVGHRFASVVTENGIARTVGITLVSASCARELTTIYNPVTVRNLNAVADGVLTLSAELVNLFGYDGSMKYDGAQMAEEIARYGLYTYEDFKDYMTEEEFGLFPFEYFKVAVGRGDYTFEEILNLVAHYREDSTLK